MADTLRREVYWSDDRTGGCLVTPGTLLLPLKTTFGRQPITIYCYQPRRRLGGDGITALGASFDIVLTLDFLVSRHGAHPTSMMFLVEFVDNGKFKCFEILNL
jgi:hypothetical protein